jgi:hypothetical protein
MAATNKTRRRDLGAGAVQGRLDAWRNGLRVRTIDEDGKDWFINRDSWPMEIAHDMVDVMKKEEGSE